MRFQPTPLRCAPRAAEAQAVGRLGGRLL